MNKREDSGGQQLKKPLDDVMRFLENFAMAWHHWLLLLSLMKLGGSGTKGQILPVYKKEGFSPHAIDRVFQTDLIDLGEAVEVEGGIDSLSNTTTIHLSRDSRFQRFMKKHLKSVVNTLKIRNAK